MRYRYAFGEYKWDQIAKLNRILHEIVSEEWVQMSAVVCGTDHGYRDDRSAIVSFRRYFRMGVFPDFIYERGKVKLRGDGAEKMRKE